MITLREATQDIEFQGHTIVKGTMMGFCTPMTHYMEEYFPDPMSFDPTRWLGKRPCPADMYTPYGVGAHVCLGAGLAEVQMLTTLAVLLRSFRFSLDDPAREMTQRLDPLPMPHRMMLRVTER